MQCHRDSLTLQVRVQHRFYLITVQSNNLVICFSLLARVRQLCHMHNSVYSFTDASADVGR